MVNVLGRKCELNKKGRSDRIWDKLCIVHQNIRSLSGKSTELEVLLETDVKNADVLCFTEHWLYSQKLHAINIDCYIVANALCRTNSEHGGPYISV